ncbi:hypothetical protein C0991_009048 [Blastosporella zonata]|nr:hypothetical protein C0991_009048 [Blastosporella zonata]
MPVNPNGLALHDMIPKENPYGDEEDPNVPKTPWIWNPATLSNDAPSASALRAAVAAAAAANPQIRHSSEPTSSDSTLASRPRHATDPSSSSASSSTNPYNNPSPLKPTFNANIIRTPAHYEPPSNASSTFADSLAHRLEHVLASEPSALGRHSSMPSIHSNSYQSTSISGVQLSEEPASILSPLGIPNPLSSIPTPKRPVARGATYPEIGSEPSLATIVQVTRPPLRVVARDGTNPDFGSQPNATSLHRSSSLVRNSPPPSQNYVPQTAPASQESFRRPLSNRTESYPAAKSTSREIEIDPPRSSYSEDLQRGVFRQPNRNHPPPDPDPYPKRQRTPPPRRPIEIYAPSPPPPQRSQSFSHTLARRPSNDLSPQTSVDDSTPRHSPPTTVGSPRHTPPSRTHQHLITPVSPNDTQVYDGARPAPVKPVRSYHPPPSLPSRLIERRRVGFYNRRGDHCTAEGYIVFAPHDKAYPEELATYPIDEYQDEFGFRIFYDAKRAELPESLPKRGQPPERPYMSFLRYNTDPKS